MGLGRGIGEELERDEFRKGNGSEIGLGKKKGIGGC